MKQIFTKEKGTKVYFYKFVPHFGQNPRFKDQARGQRTKNQSPRLELPG